MQRQGDDVVSQKARHVQYRRGQPPKRDGEIPGCWLSHSKRRIHNAEDNQLWRRQFALPNALLPDGGAEDESAGLRHEADSLQSLMRGATLARATPLPLAPLALDGQRSLVNTRAWRGVGG